jgi:hypothetical protein
MFLALNFCGFPPFEQKRLEGWGTQQAAQSAG